MKRISFLIPFLLFTSCTALGIKSTDTISDAEKIIIDDSDKKVSDKIQNLLNKKQIDIQDTKQPTNVSK